MPEGTGRRPPSGPASGRGLPVARPGHRSLLSVVRRGRYICGFLSCPAGGSAPGPVRHQGSRTIMPSPFPSTAGVLLFGQGQTPATPQQLLLQVLPFLLVGVAAWTLLYKPERERLKRQQDLLAALKKNDRVLTSAGIYGTVANVDRDSGRVILKVDDAANVKIQVALSSIASVLDASTDSAPSSG